MQFFLASDVIYSQRFLPRLLGAIEEEDLDQDVPVPATLKAEAHPLPADDLSWLTPQTVADQARRHRR